jgi:hypothetical protein
MRKLACNPVGERSQAQVGGRHEPIIRAGA